ncbi:MAG: histidinol dehydrogenase [Anaerolineae bacterium]|nr:histidinol dehydrogenase [Anaerolineae bacterium]
MKIYDVPTAKETILKRERLEAAETPQSVLDGIEQRLGARMTPEEAVRHIIAEVRARGDEALHDFNKRIDGVEIEALEVNIADIERAYEAVPESLLRNMELAIERIEAFHRKQPAISWLDSSEQGVLGQLVRPIERVGVYVPGGTAPLFSSLLMSVIPARVAGVPQIIVCSPPPIHPTILVAADLAGVGRVFRVGGAQAIAALANGTASIPKVDKVVGAGGLFVTLAKRMVYGAVGIDGLPGPTETMLIADASANPVYVAADLLAQAEHDVLASAILLTPSAALAQTVQAEVERQRARLSRQSILAQSLAERSGIVLTKDLDEAFDLANEYAPEHLCLLLDEPFNYLGKVRHAGGVFLGEGSFEVLGDYVAGPSHIMPTEGTARFASPLSVLDFVKLINVIGLNAPHLYRPAAHLAQAEKLDAHASAALARMKD